MDTHQRIVMVVGYRRLTNWFLGVKVNRGDRTLMTGQLRSGCERSDQV